MPSPTTRGRAILQAYGSNPEAWGNELNIGALQRLDDMWGTTTVVVSANYTLTIENYIADEARQFVLILTGAGGFTVTVPAVTKPYLVINRCAANCTITPAGGVGAVVRAGTAALWYCDGTDGFVVDTTLDKIKAPAASVNFNSQKATNLATPTDAADAATKVYIDTRKVTDLTPPTTAVSFNGQRIVNLATPVGAQDGANLQFVQDQIAAASTINFPPVAGQAGKFITNDGTAVSWANVIVIRDYDSRGDIRAIDGPEGGAALIEGLGLFRFVSGSTEPDDDETCFATTSGRWLMEAASWDVAYAYWLPEHDVQEQDLDAIQGSILHGTATCAITTVASLNVGSFTGTIAGVAVGDRVIATPPAPLGDTDANTGRLAFFARVTAADTVTVTLTNASAAAATTNTGIRTAWPVTVIKEIV